MADQLFPSRMQIYDENGRSLLRPRRPQVRHSGAVQIRWWSDEYSQPRKKEEYPWIPRGYGFACDIWTPLAEEHAVRIIETSQITGQYPDPIASHPLSSVVIDEYIQDNWQKQIHMYNVVSARSLTGKLETVTIRRSNR